MIAADMDEENAAAPRLIALALAEDLGERGDVTGLCFVPASSRSLGRVVARQDLVVAGSRVAAAVFARVDGSLQIERELSDGQPAKAGDTVLAIRGATRSILAAERVALNFLQRLCGVATLTREHVAQATGPRGRPGVQVLDTRKTLPGWRLLDKAAVRAGGGANHRMGLHDAVMVKDNHLVAENRAGILQDGIARARARYPDLAFVELEADRIDQVRAFLELEGVDAILLDNMTLDQLREAVGLRDELAPAVRLEASGGVSLDTIAAIAATGVDAISVGALTHSAPAADLALDLESLEAT